MNLRKNKNRLNEHRRAFSAGHMQKSKLPYTFMHSLPVENFYVHKPEASLSCFPLQSSQPYSTHPEEQTLNKQTARDPLWLLGLEPPRWGNQIPLPISADKTAWVLVLPFCLGHPAREIKVRISSKSCVFCRTEPRGGRERPLLSVAAPP